MARNYIFTHFGDLSFVGQQFLLTEDVRFLSGQIETCPNTGKLHFQGYIQFSKKCRGVKKVKDFFRDQTIHVEVARGTVDQCLAYVNKQDTRTAGPFEWGTCLKQGERTDLVEFKEAIRKGDSKRELCEKHFQHYIKYSKMVPELRRLLQPQVSIVKFKLEDFTESPLTFEKTNVVIGPSGIGKTQWALSHFMNPLFVTHIDQLGDFDSEYDGIVFDDMSFKHIPAVHQIHLVEHETPTHIHIRYTTAYIPAGTKKIFCANENPFHVELDEHNNALLKRINYVFLYDDIRRNKSR